MQRISGCPKKGKLSEPVHQRLNMYALAANAAGVGMLALAGPAEAKVVYTPVQVTIVGHPEGIYHLDLNNNGDVDFAIQDTTFNSGDFLHGTLRALPFGHNRVEGKGFVYALGLGAIIGPKQPFSAPQTMTNCVLANTLTCFGSWHGASNRYLGLKFEIGGKVHYGWARLNVMTNTNGITAQLTGYAYETIPNKAIIAGQMTGADEISFSKPDATLRIPNPKPASLGLLARGLAGFVAWRRRDSQEEQMTVKERSIL
ncbi:MAG TPA: hypothetical protein VK829_05860 [Terriglobales bacterium]|jgi:hypothetical protein|nr:hypothetical protein [Terriglobales bacterium]